MGRRGQAPRRHPEAGTGQPPTRPPPPPPPRGFTAPDVPRQDPRTRRHRDTQHTQLLLPSPPGAGGRHADTTHTDTDRPCAGGRSSLMILPQVHLRKPCYDFYFL